MLINQNVNIIALITFLCVEILFIPSCHFWSFCFFFGVQMMSMSEYMFFHRFHIESHSMFASYKIRFTKDAIKFSIVNITTKISSPSSRA